MKILMILVIFLFLGGLFIVSEHNLNLGDTDDFKSFTGLYISWLDRTFSNIVAITGQVVNLEWLPDTNKTG